MSLDEEGFLSPTISEWIARFRVQFSDWFNLADRLSRTGQQIVLSAEITTNRGATEPKLIALLLVVRTLSNFQGALLLAERGMIVEARTLVRCCLENVFCLGALLRGDTEFVKEMIGSEVSRRKAMANWMLSNKSTISAQEMAERLRKYIQHMTKTWDKTQQMNFERIAERSEVHLLYLQYRVLSGDSAHPTVTALDRYIIPAEDEISAHSVQWGPDYGDAHIADTLETACNAVIAACVIFTEMIGDADGNRQVATITDDYAELIGRKGASNSAI